MVLKSFWSGLGAGARASLLVGVLLVVGATVLLGMWLLRTEHEVLFNGLAPQDAALMTAELDRMKVPYVIGDDGTAILVDKKSLHQTRLKLMSKDIPLHGAVGFELFNNADFGMTEFAQKVNFQRALQGEITRTILSLAEVETVRVHLAFPEEGLFKREQSQAKAAVTLALKHGQALRPEQVKGIQRLVAASVTGIAPGDVTIVDQRGVALTRQGAAAATADVSPQLELKREIEQHLADKATQVLDKTFGPGQALASVDVALDMNQVRITKEEVTGAPAKPGELVTGVVVRERETVKDDPVASQRDASRSVPGTSHRETDYQVGRRIEQVVSQPGSIRSLQILAVVRVPLDAAQVAQTRALIGAAVGASAERGDTVVVQPLDTLLSPSRANLAAAGPGASQAVATVTDDSTASPSRPVPTPSSAASFARPDALVLILLGAIALLGLVLLAWVLGRRWLSPRQAAPALSEQERQSVLQTLRDWTDTGMTGLSEPGSVR